MVSSLPVQSKRLTAWAWTLEAVNLFCYHRVSSGKTCPRPQRSDGSRPRSIPENWKWPWRAWESPSDSSDIPPFAFEAPGSFSKKVPLPELCFIPCKKEESAIRDWKAWPPMMQTAPSPPLRAADYTIPWISTRRNTRKKFDAENLSKPLDTTPMLW